MGLSSCSSSKSVNCKLASISKGVLLLPADEHPIAGIMKVDAENNILFLINSRLFILF
jgi:hypothetical protein